MADSNYEVGFRRRREKKTDYDQRRELLKSGKPRAVVRTSNSHTRVHIARFDREGDENDAQSISKELTEYGWEGSTGNLPTAYLTGYLAGKRTGADEAILDKGLRKIRPGSRVFAAVAGLREAGVEVPVGEEMLPEEGRLRGEHIEEMHDTDTTENFEETRERIEEDY